MSLELSKIEELLGDEASYLLEHESKTVSKDNLVLPSPNYVDEVWYPSTRQDEAVQVCEIGDSVASLD